MKNAFATWKIIAAIGIGLIVTGCLIWKQINTSQFVIVEKGTGNYAWKDTNHNKQIDTSECNVSVKGNVEKKGLLSILNAVHWTKNSYWWLFAALLCMLGRDIAYMVRIKILSKHQLNWKSSFNVVLLWEFASAVSPGAVGGASVAMFILNREKINLGRSTTIVMITALMDNLFFILLIPLVFMIIPPVLLFPLQTSIDKSIAIVFWGGYTLIGIVCLLLYLGIFRYPTAIANLLKFLCKSRLLNRFLSKTDKLSNDMLISAAILKKERWTFWLKGFSATFISWISRYMVINCLLASFFNISLGSHMLIIAKQLILWIFMLISPTPGGSGVAEYAFGELMGVFSQSTLLIIFIALLWRLISYFPYLIIGSILLPIWLKKTSS